MCGGFPCCEVSCPVFGGRFPVAYQKISSSLPVHCGCCGIKKGGTYWSICPKFLPLHHSAREGKGRWVREHMLRWPMGRKKEKNIFVFPENFPTFAVPPGTGGGKKIRYGRPLAASGYKCRSAKRRRYKFFKEMIM